MDITIHCLLSSSQDPSKCLLFHQQKIGYQKLELCCLWLLPPMLIPMPAGSFPATVLHVLSLKISVLSRILDPEYPPITILTWQRNDQNISKKTKLLPSFLHLGSCYRHARISLDSKVPCLSACHPQCKQRLYLQQLWPKISKICNPVHAKNAEQRH